MNLSLSCQQARAMVSDYINGELDQELRRALEQHLQHCESCPPLYASLVTVKQRLRGLVLPTAAFSLEARIAQKIRQVLREG
jgi:anti-sigma factor RsiW